MKDWWTAAELAASGLPGLAATERSIQMRAKRERWADRITPAGEPGARKRKGRGGGAEYHFKILPSQAQTALIARSSFDVDETALRQEKATRTKLNLEETWAWYDSLPDSRKKKAEERLAALDKVTALKEAGMAKNDAVCQVAREIRKGKSAIYEWFNLVRDIDRAYWLAFLTPRHVGRTAKVEIDPRAWDFFVAVYMRAEQPAFSQCYQWLKAACDEHGWERPAERTLRRKINEHFSHAQQVYAREGAAAAKRLYQTRERDRTGLHALEAVNADFYIDDVMIKWPDGSEGRPAVVEIMDLYSNLPLAWRVDKTPNATTVRLAFYDVFRKYGIPDRAWLDNGREFASKVLTGGQATRFRFSVKPGEIDGLFTQLDMKVHWATPYSGQSKPIERAFRERREQVAKHPAMAGAYTGRSPMHKPHNYGERAVPLEDYLKILHEAHRLNAERTGRRTKVCAGVKSFQQAFDESYERAQANCQIRKATASQLRKAMLAAENVTARRPSGGLHLMGNVYWAEFLIEFIGKKLTMRYDPDDLHGGVHVYSLDGRHLGFAECWEDTGFENFDDARKVKRDVRAFEKKQKELLSLEMRLSAQEAAARMPQRDDEHEPPETDGIRLVANGRGGSAPQPQEMSEEEQHEALREAFRLHVIEGGRDGI